eukprot:425813_1
MTSSGSLSRFRYGTNIYDAFPGSKIIRVKRNSMIYDIKKQIESKLDIPSTTQRLTLAFVGKTLNDNCSVTDYNIRNGATLFLSVDCRARTDHAQAQPSPVNTSLRVRVHVQTGELILQFTLPKSSRIQKVRKFIAKSERIPTSVISLYFKGTILSDTKTLEDYSIADNTVTLCVKAPDIQIFVKTFNNQTITIDTNIFHTIRRLRDTVNAKRRIERLEPDEQHLYFQQIELIENDKRLYTYQIESESIIELSSAPYHTYRKMQAAVIDASSKSAEVIKQTILHKLENLDALLSELQRTINNASSLVSFTNISASVLSKIDHGLVQLRMHTPFTEQTMESKRSIESNCHKQTEHYQQSYTTFTRNIGKYKKEIGEIKMNIKTLQQRVVQLEKLMQTAKSSSVNYRSYLTKYESVKDKSITKLDAQAAEVEETYHSCIQRANHDERLREIINKKRTHFEKDYKKWNVNETMAWIRTVENAYFDKKEFETFMNAIHEMHIDGTQLTEMNSKLFLNLAGLSREKDQYIVRKHINRIVKQKNDMEYRNVCGVCMTNVINTVMIPCGHCFSCWSCSEKQKIKKCPMCRKDVKQILKTFLSGYSKINE